jgi:hypothetical protein
MVEDVAGEVSRTARWLGVSLEADAIDDVARTLSYDAQSRRIASLPDEAWVEVNRANIYDRHSLLHRNHLQSGRVGRYLEQLEAHLILAIEEVAAGWLRDNGYPCAIT